MMIRRHRRVLLVFLPAFLVTASCQKPQPRESVVIKPTVKSPPKRAAGQRGPQRMVVGASVENRPIETVTFGNGPDVTLIMATIHGNEDAGTPLVQALTEHLSRHPKILDGRRVVLMPCTNPDGMARQLRTNLRGVDLNRNFPAENYDATSAHGDSPLSEPESKAIHRVLLEECPDRIVSLHQPLNWGAACVDYDGPGEELARVLSDHGDLPLEKLGSRPGSLGSYAGLTLGIPIITVELPKEAKGMGDLELWDLYGGMLLQAIMFPGESAMLAEASE